MLKNNFSQKYAKIAWSFNASYFVQVPKLVHAKMGCNKKLSKM